MGFMRNLLRIAELQNRVEASEDAHLVRTAAFGFYGVEGGFFDEISLDLPFRVAGYDLETDAKAELIRMGRSMTAYNPLKYWISWIVGGARKNNAMAN